MAGVHTSSGLSPVFPDEELDVQEKAAEIPQEVLEDVFDYQGKFVPVQDLRTDSATGHPLETYLGDQTYLWKGNATFTALSQITNAGTGLYALREFRLGEKLCIYSGTMLRTKDAIRRKDKRYLMRLGPQTYVDPLHHYSILARYINDPRNVSLHNVRFDKQPQAGCAIVEATCTILPGEELFVDYGRLYWVKDPGQKLVTASRLPVEAWPA